MSVGKSARTAFAEMGVMLRQLAALDQASSEDELNRAIPSLLESIGVLTSSDRVYVFEWSGSNDDCFENSFEWCAPGKEGRILSLKQAGANGIERWMPFFKRNEPLVVRDIEDLREDDPDEYEALKSLGIRSLVALPMFVGNQLVGFSGVDNPGAEGCDDPLVVQLLSAASGHLARLRENMRGRALLRENQLTLERNLRELKREKALLDAMSIDYTAVYACDLTHDVIEMRREKTGANSITLDERYPEVARCYSLRLRGYFENYVVAESCPDFLERLSLERLRRDLAEAPRVAFRFMSKPNERGYEQFEVQVIRVRSDEDEFRIVMGFRYIDEIVAEEERRRRRLQEALDLAQLNNEIISAISKIYWVIYRIDLRMDYFEEITADAEMHRLTGRSGSASQVIGKSLPAIVAPESELSMRMFMDLETLPERLAGCETISQEYLAADGKWHSGRFIVKKRDEAGEPVVMLYASRIIDEQKRRELEYQRELRITADEARRANVAKTDFLRRMSHDIRTPINGIRGMVEIANHFPDDPERQQDCRNKIWNASSYLLSLVNSVLDMNKLESGSIMLDSKPFDLHELLHEVASIAQAQAIEHGVTFVLESHAKTVRHWHLVGSPAHLKQILLNLASNAVKYNRERGEVRLSCVELVEGQVVAAAAGTAAGAGAGAPGVAEEAAVADGALPGGEAESPRGVATFRFVCADTGIGMSEEFQRSAFEPFTQEDRSDARTHYQGSGLGLSITKHLVEIMGGTISLESEEGRGTMFAVELPLAIDESAQSSEPGVLDAGAVSGMRVLMVEDNELNAEIAEFLLEGRGIDVTTVGDGKRAVDVLLEAEPGTFDVVLMDIMMPVMNGLDAARLIRASGRDDLRTLPIFAMSANAFTDDIRASLDAGMNGHLTKPLEEDRIIATLAACNNATRE